MDRTFSDQTHTRRTHAPPYPSALPPWEVRNMAQVPFLEPGSPPPIQRDTQGFFTSRSASRSPPNAQENSQSSRDNSNSHNRPRLGTAISAPPATDYASPSSVTTTSNPWNQAGPLPQYPSYETQTLESPAYIPPGPRTAPTKFPSFVATRAPPTPPDSFSRTSPSPSPPTQHHETVPQPSQALPGTMSSRTSQRHGKSASREARRPRVVTKGSSEERGFGKFKTAWKGMFYRSPVDESQFERVSGKHWTEED